MLTNSNVTSADFAQALNCRFPAAAINFDAQIRARKFGRREVAGGHGPSWSLRGGSGYAFFACAQSAHLRTCASLCAGTKSARTCTSLLEEMCTVRMCPTTRL